MCPHADSLASRRRVLTLLVNGLGALIGGALAALLGVFAVRPARGAEAERWIRAGTLGDLVPDTPVPRVLSVPRVDGWYRGRARQTVFLVWTGLALAWRRFRSWRARRGAPDAEPVLAARD